MLPSPFQQRPEYQGSYGVVAHIESDTLWEIYPTVFRKYGYEPNGYTWHGHIEVMLAELASDLLPHLDFDPEAGGFYVYADSPEAQHRFVDVLDPIFRDLTVLESWVAKADPERIAEFD